MGVRLWFFALLLACCLVVWWRGAREERLAMVVVVIGSITTACLAVVGKLHFDHVQAGPVAVDIVCLAAFLWIALTSRYYWPMLLAAFQLAAVSTHGAMLIDPTLLPRAYAVGLALWIYPMLALIVWASLSDPSSLIKRTFSRR